MVGGDGGGGVVGVGAVVVVVVLVVAVLVEVAVVIALVLVIVPVLVLVLVVGVVVAIFPCLLKGTAPGWGALCWPRWARSSTCGLHGRCRVRDCFISVRLQAP